MDSLPESPLRRRAPASGYPDPTPLPEAPPAGAQTPPCRVQVVLRVLAGSQQAEEVVAECSQEEAATVRRAVRSLLSPPEGRGVPVRWTLWNDTFPDGVEVSSSARLAQQVGCSPTNIHVAERSAKVLEVRPFEGIPEGVPVARSKGSFFCRSALLREARRD